MDLTVSKSKVIRICVVTLGWLALMFFGPASHGAERFEAARVISVVDGDTIKVEFTATKGIETIRLIGVDTPETKHPRRGVEPFGPEASRFTKDCLLGRIVHVQTDLVPRDRYGRLLAYIWTFSEGETPSESDPRQNMFNAVLLAEGLARTMTIPPNVRYADLFAEVQREARKQKRGGWGIWQEE